MLSNHGKVREGDLEHQQRRGGEETIGEFQTEEKGKKRGACSTTEENNAGI